MPGASKSPEEWIRFLLSIIDHQDGKIDFEGVAKDTSMYKSGKFARQALNNVRKNYGGPIDEEDKLKSPAGTPKTPTSTKKRGSTDIAGSSRKQPAKKAKKMEESSDGDEGSSGEVEDKAKINGKDGDIDMKQVKTENATN